jgi:uncharacterized protein (DUF1810 family)
MNSDLTRFIEAQKKDYSKAFSEIQTGKKLTHWMWYIFPQISGLGFSETAKYYGIKNSEEAIDYFNEEYLGTNLIGITKLLIDLNANNANKIFGYPDDLKLRSSMTLFYLVSNKNEIFKSIIDKYFNGVFCEKTIQLLNK